ncbi:MAG: NHL repeat-containing protein [Melioribacteraceae bacterium]|nr:NHL repeat-containing protein [Melioribacteraceae bacterium]
MIKILFITLFTSTIVITQELIYEDSIGKFESACAFTINQAGSIFVTDKELNEIYKFDRTGALLHNIGGYGWDKELFDYPSDIFTNLLNVYVTDRNNNRIQIFDKDLNYLSDIKPEDLMVSFNYPEGCVVSNQGDVFILDSDNQRVIKLDLSGEFIMQIGDIDAGIFKLNDPVDLAVSGDGKLFVTDGSKIKVFDLFGNGLSIIETDIKDMRITIFSNFITISNNKRVLYLNLSEELSGFKELDVPDLNDGKLIEALFAGNGLYLLFPTEIKYYTLKY